MELADYQFDLRDIFRIIRRQKGILILSPILAGLLTFWLSPIPPPEYQAQSVVKTSRVVQNMQALLIESMNLYEGDNIATQSHILASQKIKVRVAIRLADKHPEFREVKAMLEGLGKEDYDALEQKLQDNPDLADLVNSVEVSADGRGSSDLIDITAVAPWPDLARDTANYAAEEFVDYTVAERNSQIREAARFIRARISETEQGLRQAGQELEEFKKFHTITLGLNVEDSGGIQEQIENLSREISGLDEGIARLEKTNSAEDYLAFSPALDEVDDSLVYRLEQQLLDLIDQVHELNSQQRELLTYQTISSAEAQQNIVKAEELETRVAEIMATLLRRYQVIRGGLDEVRQGLVERQRRLETIPGVVRQLEDLERQVELRNDSLNLLQRRLQDAEIQKAGEVKEVSIVERATYTTHVARTSRHVKALAGLLIGCLLGGVFALLLESMDTSIGTIEDVERYLRLPVLGVIPHLDEAVVKSRILVKEMGAGATSEDVGHMSRLCTHFAQTEPFSEAFRSMRAQLDVLLRKNGWKSLMVTSSVLQEGKTNTAVNLAIVFAQAGQRTLLIDADLRRPKVHKVFGLPRKPGLSDVLLGTTGLDSATRSFDDLVLGKMGLSNTQVAPGLGYLSLISAGSKVDHPAEVLSLQKVSDILSTVRDEYDIIIVDIAPVLPIADASQLVPGIDATVLAYQIGRVGREVVNRTRRRLEDIGGNVVGIIMNDIAAEIYGPSSEYEYSYRYDEDEPSQTVPAYLSALRERVRLSLRRARLGRRSEARSSRATVAPETGGEPESDQQDEALEQSSSSLCRQCGAAFVPEEADDRFCSDDCASVYQLSRVGQRGIPKRPQKKGRWLDKGNKLRAVPPLLLFGLYFGWVAIGFWSDGASQGSALSSLGGNTGLSGLPSDQAVPDPILGEASGHNGPSPGKATAESAEAGLMDSAVPTTRSSESDGASFFLQVGAFQNPDGARALGERLGVAGFSARIFPESGVHRVAVGPFTTRGEASRASQELEALGYESFLRRFLN